MSEKLPSSLADSSPQIPALSRPADWMFLQPSMLDQMHDAVISTDLNGVVIGCNRAVSTIYGYLPDELIGQSVSVLYAKEDRHLLMDSVVPAVRETGSFRGEIRNCTRTGDYIYVHLSVALLRDADGKPTGMVGFSVDVTAQKLGDLALRRSLEVEREFELHKAASAGMRMLFAAVERAQDVILLTEAEPIVEPGPRIVYVNQAFQKMTGFTPEEVIGKTPRILQGPKSDTAALQRIHDALSQWQPIREELINYRKDGSTFWVDMSIFPIADERGWYTHWMAIQRDTTAQNTVREKLADGESRHRFLTEAIPQLLWTADADGNCTFVSQSCASFLGMSVTDCLNGGWYSAVHPDDLERTRAQWRESVEHATNFVVEYRLRRHDGQYLWFLHRASPRKDSDGHVLEWIGTSTDIALQKQAEETLRQTEKLAAVGRLASSIAHEINNPLESVTNLLYLIGRNPSLDQTARKFVSTAQDELARVSAITTQTLRFHKQSTSAAPTRTSELIESILSLYRSRIAAAGIQVTFEHERAELLNCRGGEIRQAIGNVIGNAVDALRQGGRLRIRKRPSRSWSDRNVRGIRITVADNGYGIDPAHRSRLFEPFFTTKGAVGTGLGLWLTKGTIDKHNGSISVRSSIKPGASGTVVSIFLPFETGQTAEP